MRVALRQKAVAQAQVSKSQSYPAPIGGWNARDALAQMKPTEAVSLVNWMPKTTYLEMRGGCANHATGMTGNGKTLAVHNGVSGTNKMFCLTASGTYDATSPGAVGASVAARTNGKHRYVMFGDGTSNWLILVNGVDKPLYYDGSAWVAVDAASTPALTGLTTTSIIGVNIFKERLLFIEKDSLSFWYLATGVAGGALTEFDLSGVAQKGGYLMAIGSWSVDAGDGPDDRAVFITSEGETLIYVGDNPSDADHWALVGRYQLPRPLGRRCITNAGGDLLIITENGVFPLSAAIQSAQIDAKLAISFKIENAFTDAARSYGSTFGWRVSLFTPQSAVIVNVPIAEDGTHEQYVMNTITKAWTRFTGWNAEDFAILNGSLYFTVGTKVVKAWTGASDYGANIEAYGKTAFSYFGSPGQLKQFTMFRPVLAINGTLPFLTDIDTDFYDNPIQGSLTYTLNAGGVWDTALWDSATWSAGMEIQKEWTSPRSYPAYCAAGKIKVATNSRTVQWLSCDWMFNPAGIL